MAAPTRLKSLAPSLFAGFILVAPTYARAADLAGAWLVRGKISAFAFTLHCVFKTAGSVLSGVCTDGSTSDPTIKGGRAHPLTAGAVEGSRVTWTYRSSFLFTHFDVTYAGALTGDHMQGVIRTSGREGAFTADRE